MKIKTFAFVAALFLGLTSGASAQTVPLKSFAYASTGCSNGMLYFGTNWQMGAAWAKPGAGVFPDGDFYIRAISLTVMGGTATDWVVIGHWGPNGDWITPAVLSGHEHTVVFPADAAPLFTAGEYLDAHVSSCNGVSALLNVWYAPAP